MGTYVYLQSWEGVTYSEYQEDSYKVNTLTPMLISGKHLGTWIKCTSANLSKH